MSSRQVSQSFPALCIPPPPLIHNLRSLSRPWLEPRPCLNCESNCDAGRIAARGAGTANQPRCSMINEGRHRNGGALCGPLRSEQLEWIPRCAVLVEDHAASRGADAGLDPQLLALLLAWTAGRHAGVCQFVSPMTFRYLLAESIATRAACCLFIALADS